VISIPEQFVIGAALMTSFLFLLDAAVQKISLGRRIQRVLTAGLCLYLADVYYYRLNKMAPDAYTELFMRASVIILFLLLSAELVSRWDLSWLRGKRK
jgi:uncharacterized membrane protein